MVGILVSSWDCLFSGAMLVSGGVLALHYPTKNPKKSTLNLNKNKTWHIHYRLHTLRLHLPYPTESIGDGNLAAASRDLLGDWYLPFEAACLSRPVVALPHRRVSVDSENWEKWQRPEHIQLVDGFFAWNLKMVWLLHIFRVHMNKYYICLSVKMWGGDRRCNDTCCTYLSADCVIDLLLLKYRNLLVEVYLISCSTNVNICE